MAEKPCSSRMGQCQLNSPPDDAFGGAWRLTRTELNMIRLDNVTKSYGGSIAINSVSLTIPQGKTTALIGPSGSGKSTLLALIIGLELPDDGKIAIDAHPLTPRSALNLRRRMGYVIQDGGLFPHLTAQENIGLMANEAGWPPKRRKVRLNELCTLTRFSPTALDRYPIELSGGQRQRVSLMRALMLDPDVLLMDEPLGALDPMIRADLQDDLKTIFQNLAKTVVLVTHDLSEAAFFSDSIILMHQGHVVQQGQFRDLIDSPADPFVSQFVHAQLRRLTMISERAMTSETGRA
jgi:osmoprotectant transport system ATP-binding protein